MKELEEVVRLTKLTFNSFNSLADLELLFYNLSLIDVSDDLVKNGWIILEGDWGTRTVFQKYMLEEKFYAQWEVNAVHSTTKEPVGYWKVTYGKINATSKNTIRISPSPNFKP